MAFEAVTRADAVILAPIWIRMRDWEPWRLRETREGEEGFGGGSDGIPQKITGASG